MMAELYMYLSIYKLLINHDRKMKLVLTSTSVNKRVQKNVISLAGHAVNFAVETLWSVFFLYIAIQGMPKDQDQLFHFHLFEQSLYGVLSVLQILFSHPLRSDCIDIWNTVFEKCFILFPSESFLKLIVHVSNMARTS